MKGSIRTRTLADGSKRYDAIVYTGIEKHRWKTFTKLREAEQYLANAVKNVHEGTFVSVKPVSMADVFDRWETHADSLLSLGKLKPSTLKSYKAMVNTHLRPAFKDYRSDRLTADVVESWARDRAADIAADRMSGKYYNNLITLLGGILGWGRGRARRYLAHDPLTDVELAARRRAERDYLEPAEVAALLKAATPPDDAILYIAAYAGLRRGELFALKWDDVEEHGKSGGRLHVRRSVYQGDVTTPKTAHSARAVDVPRKLLDVLQRHREACPPDEGGYIFRTDEGTPIDPDNWSKRSLPAVRTRAKLRDFGLHTLRHTYASILIAQGESIKYVSRQLGHASIQITADTYGHLFRETSTAAMRRLDRKALTPRQPKPQQERHLRVVVAAAV